MSSNQPAELARPLPRRLASRWTQLVLGLAGWGLAVTLMVRSGLGLGPWDALHVGLHQHLGIGVGTASIGVGLVILVASLFIGVRPGVGTVANMVLIGLTIDLLLPIIPVARDWPLGLAYLLGGIGLAGWFTGVYVGAGLGKGPRDGLVIALSERLGWPVRRVRTLIELSVLGLGWALGGPLGAGTVIYALTVGPSMQWGMRRWGLLAPSGSAVAELGPRERAPRAVA
jgi:uncharacterized membrane protein YczE